MIGAIAAAIGYAALFAVPPVYCFIKFREDMAAARLGLALMGAVAVTGSTIVLVLGVQILLGAEGL